MTTSHGTDYFIKKKTECVIVIVLLYKVKLRICGIESERSRKTNIAYQLHVESKKKKVQLRETV